MNTRTLMVAALSLGAVAAQASVTFTVLSAYTNGVGGVQSLTTGFSGSTISASGSRTAGAIPASLNLDVKAQESAGPITSVTYKLYFSAASVTAASQLKGTFSFNPVGVNGQGGDADLAGSSYSINGPNYAPLNTLGVVVGSNYVVTHTETLWGNSSKWHFVLDNAWKNATLDKIDVSVVPEPASMTILAVGALGLLRRRKSK